VASTPIITSSPVSGALSNMEEKGLIYEKKSGIGMVS